MAEILKEYVIPVKFMETGLKAKQVISSLSSVAARALAVGSAVGLAALKVTKWAAGTADDILNINNLSVRTAVGVKQIRALQYAFQGAGRSAGEANQTITTLAKNLASANAGGEYLRVMNRLAISARTPLELFTKLESKIRELHRQGVGEMQLGMRLPEMGLPADILRDILSGRLDRKLREGRRIGARMGDQPGENLRASKEMNSAWQEASRTLSIEMRRLAVQAMPALSSYLRGLTSWLRDTWPDIQETFKDLGTVIGVAVKVMKNIGDILNLLLQPLKGVLDIIVRLRYLIPGWHDALYAKEDYLEKKAGKVTKNFLIHLAELQAKATQGAPLAWGGLYNPDEYGPKGPRSSRFGRFGPELVHTPAPPGHPATPSPVARPQPQVTMHNTITINTTADPHDISTVMTRYLQDYIDLSINTVGSPR